MKRKLSIKELVEELRNQSVQKKDMIIPSSCLKMENGRMVIQNVNDSEALNDMLSSTGISTVSEAHQVTMDILDGCHKHIAGKLGIPANYYDTLTEEKNLPCLDFNVNHWLGVTQRNYLIRTFIDKEEKTGIMRAMLSDRFKVIDNLDVLMAALEAIRLSGVEIQVLDADLSEKRMYARFIAPGIVKNSPELLRNYKVPNTPGAGGDSGIVAGFVLTNSETGDGVFSITPRLVVRACTNGMIMQKDAFRKTHLGEKLGEFSEIKWSDETKEKNLELIIAQTKDAVKTFLSEDFLGKSVARLEEEGGKVLQYPVDAIKNVSKELAFSEQKQKDLLDFFIKGADTTAFGIAQAMTYFAHAKADADEQYEMEKAAVGVLSDVKQYDKPYSEKAARKTGNKSFLNN